MGKKENLDKRRRGEREEETGRSKPGKEDRRRWCEKQS